MVANRHKGVAAQGDAKVRRVAWVVFAVGVVMLVAVLMLPREHHYAVIPNTAHLLPSADPAHGHHRGH
jgi:hypothetical protein